MFKVFIVFKKKDPCIVVDTECAFCCWLLFMVGSHFDFLFQQTCPWLVWPLGCSEPAVAPLARLTGSRAQGNAIFIQSVFRMSWGRNTSPTQSSLAAIPFIPRSNHNYHKTTTPYCLSPCEK
jgi:hypothetical protein